MGEVRERFGIGLREIQGVWEMFGDVPERTKEKGQFGKQLTEKRKKKKVVSRSRQWLLTT